jgi:hypothetical protein
MSAARQQTTVPSAPARNPVPGALLQRKCACGNHTLAGSECAACGKSARAISSAMPPIQRFARQTARPADVAPASVGHALGGPGRPLEPALRWQMEQRFGHDFSGVRIHTGATAETSARELNAQAYTVGRDIVFDAGRYAPGTHEGQRLLAHELTHFVQQRGQRAVAQTQLAVSTPGDAGEREADAAADAVMHGRGVSSITPALPTVQRKCHATELGAPHPDCTPSQAGSGGWQLLFKVGCDDLLPGEEAKIDKLKPGNQLKIHGFASREGDASFNSDLSCHRANKVAELVRVKRADCPVVGTFKHGASPVSAPGLVPDVNPPGFWRSVIIEEVKPALESGELWLDPGSTINLGWALLHRAKADPSSANLDVVAARRAGLKAWLESIGKTLAPTGAQLTRRNLDDYRRFYASAERLWAESDQLLALHRHADAAKDTYVEWARGTGADQGSRWHAKNVPTGARYQVDIFGEGYFQGAVNIGMAERTSTTGVHNARVPNLIYRRFSSKDANHLPIADHAADLVTSENGPIGLPGLADEIARIIAPGGTIVLVNPDSEEAAHDKVAKATGGTVTKVRTGDMLQTTIVVPGP